MKKSLMEDTLPDFVCHALKMKYLSILRMQYFPGKLIVKLDYFCKKHEMQKRLDDWH